MKRFWRFGLLLCSLLIFAMPVRAAEDEAVSSYSGSGDLQMGQYARKEDGLPQRGVSRSADEISLEEVYERAVLNWQTRVDVASFGIPVAYADEILSDVRNQFPKYFYAEIRSYRYSLLTGMVISIEIEYVAGREEINAYEAAVAQALAQVRPDMTDVDKALVLHDYIALNCAYDEENLEAETLPDTVYQSYGVFVLGSAVCQGYALAYQDLLDRAGIPCFTVGSDEMDHAWNIVELDGEFYHVDVTWDDPVWDTLGQVFHDYFLLSDETISSEEGGHYGWDSYVEAESKIYEEGFWTESMTGIYQRDGYFYYMDSSGNLIKRSVAEDTETVLTTVRDKWEATDQQGWYRLCFARLILANDRLYYNTPNQVRSINMDGTEDVLVDQPEASSHSIYGMSLQGEQLVCDLKQSPSELKLGSYKTVENFSFLVTGMWMSETDLNLKENESSYLYALTLPNYRLCKDAVWESSNKRIASVSSDGMVKALSEGNAVVSASSASARAAAYCRVEAAHLSEYGMVEKAATCKEKGVMAYRCSGCNELLYRKEIPLNNQHNFGSWKITEPATIFAAGSRTRTCTRCGRSENQGIAKKKGKVTLSAKSAPIQVKRSTTSIRVTSSTEGDQVAGWKSSNTKVVSVNKKTGKLTGKKEGKATVTVTMKSGAKARCLITVQKKPVKTEKLKLNKKNIALKRGKTFQISVLRVPVTAKEKVTYRTSSSKIVSVSKKGVLRGKKKGKAVITVKSGNGKIVTCTVRVK